MTSRLCRARSVARSVSDEPEGDRVRAAIAVACRLVVKLSRSLSYEASSVTLRSNAEWLGRANLLMMPIFSKNTSDM